MTQYAILIYAPDDGADFPPAEMEAHMNYGAQIEKLGSRIVSGYALQGIGAMFIESIAGSYTNVIGLPLERLYPHLRRHALLPASTALP